MTLGAHPLSVPQAEPSSKIDDLADAFETERRLLDELARVLSRQRDGLAANDMAILDESVFSAQRVFLTLQQARRRRRTLLEMVAGESDVQLGELEGALDHHMTPQLAEARDELLEAAHRLQGEVNVNRRVIDGALAVGEQLIRTLAGGSEAAPAYAADASVHEKGTPGAPGGLLNTKA